MNPKVSIIVPVYNAERYLERCIESILSQTHENFELILIDDGSTDESGQICDYYAQRDKRVTVKHKKNAGVSRARNDGIEISRGVYIQFVDSDDYLDENMTELLLDVVNCGEPDIVICGFKMIDKETNKYTEISYKQPEMNIDSKKYLTIHAALYQQQYINNIWNKLYKTSLIKEHHILFDSALDLGEDLVFNIEVLKRCDYISIISSCPYNYMIYKSGHNLSDRYRINIYDIQKYLFEQVISLYPDSHYYSEEVNRLGHNYSRYVLTTILPWIAQHTSLKDYTLYFGHARSVHEDEVLARQLQCGGLNSRQERLLGFLLRRNMYGCIYLYSKIREFIRKRLPSIFGLLRKCGAYYA